MRVKTNPTLEMTSRDRAAINHVWRMCGNLLCTIDDATMTEDACIVCVDNGEVFVTAKEVYTMYNALETMCGIMANAPYKDSDKTCGDKELAINFID